MNCATTRARPNPASGSAGAPARDEGKLDTGAAITEDALIASGLVRRKLDGIRVLAKGDFTAKVDLSVTGASKSAVDAVAKAGGSLSVTSATAAE